MATPKKNTKSAGDKKPMRDLQPSKNAKGGGRHAENNRPGSRVQQNSINRKSSY